MPGSDTEVFEALTGDGDDPNAEDYITYALFAFERREWIAHYTRERGQAPSEADLQAWVQNITAYQFEQMRRRAATFFDAAARSYMAVEIEQIGQDLLRTFVVREVKAAGSFWRQFAIALLTAILAPLLIGLVVVAALRSEDYMPTIKGTKDAVQSGSNQPSKSKDQNQQP
ncbi:hypothetical protein [Methylobacterium sp. SD21]|uniref:hypothetical protein n=1 Tax=Methylobacterium litchii TaxID=3138810 RepID=UPI00313CAD25